MDVERNKAFARALAKVCRDFEAYNLDIRFTLREPGPQPFEEARVMINRGRHGSEGRINLVVTTRVGDFGEFEKGELVERR